MPSSFAMDVTAQDVVDGEADTELRAVVELEKLGRLFDEADTDGSGTIDKSEFTNLQSKQFRVLKTSKCIGNLEIGCFILPTPSKAVRFVV